MRTAERIFRRAKWKRRPEVAKTKVNDSVSEMNDLFLGRKIQEAFFERAKARADFGKGDEL